MGDICARVTLKRFERFSIISRIFLEKRIRPLSLRRRRLFRRVMFVFTIVIAIYCVHGVDHLFDIRLRTRLAIRGKKEKKGARHIFLVYHKYEAVIHPIPF